VNGATTLLRTLVGEPIDLSIACGESLDLVRVDRTQLEQILFNLAVNARDAMPHGGRLEIQTGRADASTVATLAGARPYVMISVADSGVGMSRETMARAFQPFFTTKDVGKGSGLGLSTVHDIVKQNGGVVTLESQPG